MKKRSIISLVIALCLIVPMLFCFTSCSSGSEKEMNVSINPEVTFIVNGKDKIASVKFENSDADSFYADINFKGMSVESALQVMVDKYAISGNYKFEGTKDVTITINGSVDADVEALQTKAKDKVTEAFGKLGITANIELPKVSKDDLVKLVNKYAPELADFELNEMSEKELVKLIKEKQEEYAGLASSQVDSLLTSLTTGADKAKYEAVEAAKKIFKAAKEALDSAEETLNKLPKDSAFRAGAEQSVKNAKSALKSAEEDFDKLVAEFDNVKAGLIKAAKEDYAKIKSELESKYNEAVKSFADTYKTTYETQVNKLTSEQQQAWADLVAKYNKAA